MSSYQSISGVSIVLLEKRITSVSPWTSHTAGDERLCDNCWWSQSCDAESAHKHNKGEQAELLLLLLKNKNSPRI